MGNIYCKKPAGGLFYGLQQPFATGTVVYCPENHFGVARQGENALKFFDEKVTVNAKDIPGLKVPFLFGKVQGLDMYFYPYGLSGVFTKKDLVFTTKTGRKAKISLKVKYKVEIDNVYNVLVLNKKLKLSKPNEDGTLTTPEAFTDYIAKYILEEGDSAYAKMGLSGLDSYVIGQERSNPNRRGKPGEIVTLELKGMLSVGEMFKNFGYKLSDDSITNVDVLSFEFLD